HSHRPLRGQPRPRGDPGAPGAPVRALRLRRRALHRPRPGARRLPDVALRRRAGGHARRAAPLARDDGQERRRRPAAWRRRGLARAGAGLLVADIDERKRALADELGARWTTPERALTAPVDVVAPCALGGVLDDESVSALQCRVVAGAANNQLADDRIADVLHERGILWAPDFVANAGGIVNIAVELEPAGYDPRRARR